MKLFCPICKEICVSKIDLLNHGDVVHKLSSKEQRKTFWGNRLEILAMDDEGQEIVAKEEEEIQILAMDNEEQEIQRVFHNLKILTKVLNMYNNFKKRKCF